MATATLRHWQTATRSRSLQAAVVASALIHFGMFAVVITNWRPPRAKAIPIAFEVNFPSPPSVEPDPESKAVAPPPPAPKPEPPAPEPKKEEPKPEPKKEEPKKEPEKVAEKKPDPKPEPKKEPEKKPEPKKETPPKKEPPKKEPEKKKPTPTVPAGAPSTLPTPEVVAAAPPPSSGVQQSALPSILNAWGRQVHRKVHPKWVPPGGMQLTPEQREVHISFWVGRDGMLLAQPTVVKAANQALAQSGINAIISAQPLPPLPIEYAADKQEVVYVFIVDEQPLAPGGTGGA